MKREEAKEILYQLLESSSYDDFFDYCDENYDEVYEAIHFSLTDLECVEEFYDDLKSGGYLDKKNQKEKYKIKFCPSCGQKLDIFDI